MQRKTVTLPKMIFELIDRLKNGYREIVYDTLFRAMFDNKEINYDGLPDEVVNVLIVAKYELRKIKSKYENGCVEKTYNNTPTFASKNLRSENKQNISNIEQEQAKVSPRACACDNIYSNNKNNKINKSINNNKQTNIISETEYKSKDLCEFELTQDNRDVAEFCMESLQSKIDEISSLDPVLAGKFTELAERVASQVRPMKLQGYYLAPEVILEKYINFFRCPQPAVAVERLNTIYSDFETKNNTIKISNSFKYLVAYFYNKACEY